MQYRSEKGGGSVTRIKLLLCENPLPPIATLEHEHKIGARAATLRAGTREPR